MALQKLSTCLWFDNQAEEAANFYTSIFKNSSIGRIARYGKTGHEFHGQPEGAVMTVEFELEGHKFTALNGGPVFQFNESISFQIDCETQAEVDYYWDKLSEGGDEKAQQCGWLKDKFGVSWQVVPTVLARYLSGSDPAGVQRASEAMFKMKKFDIAALQRAYGGQGE